MTGAGRGIGREFALCLAREGARSSSTTSGPASTAQEASTTAPRPRCARRSRASAARPSPRYDSVSDFEAAGRIIGTAVDAFGQIDILVNNAGIIRDRSLLKMTEEDYDAVVAVHQKGSFNCARHAAPLMKDAGLRAHHQHHVVGRAARQLRTDQLRVGEGRARWA